jgi:DNA polymerase-3 subunit gamma/tau
MTLAPDEYAGFTMTLLRMLAFAPAAAVPETPARRESPRVAFTAPPPRGSEAATAGAVTPEHWTQMLESIKVSGMARQLAQNCELVAETDGVIDLRLAANLQHLMEKGPQERLRAAIEAHLGRAVRLRISVGQLAGLTPQQLADDQRRGELASAAQSLDADPFVRDLVENLGARVVPDSIKVNR